MAIITVMTIIMNNNDNNNKNDNNNNNNDNMGGEDERRRIGYNTNPEKQNHFLPFPKLRRQKIDGKTEIGVFVIYNGNQRCDLTTSMTSFENRRVIFHNVVLLHQHFLSLLGFGFGVRVLGLGRTAIAWRNRQNGNERRERKATTPLCFCCVGEDRQRRVKRGEGERRVGGDAVVITNNTIITNNTAVANTTITNSAISHIRSCGTAPLAGKAKRRKAQRC